MPNNETRDTEKTAMPGTTAVPIETRVTQEPQSVSADKSAFLDAVHSADNGEETGPAETGSNASMFLDEQDEQDEQSGDNEDPDLSLLDGTSGTGEDSSGDEDEEGFLEVDNENCLRCNSLVPFMTKTFKSCHFTAGNKNCPAKSVKIIIKIPLDEIVPRFLSAERDADFDRLGKLASVLSKKPDWYQKRVREAIEQARTS